MPELWFGPDRDPDYIQPVLPLDALEALNDLGHPIGASRARDWHPSALGFAAVDTDGDALAAAMGGVHLDGPFTAGPLDLDDLLDPWVLDIEATHSGQGAPRN